MLHWLAIKRLFEKSAFTRLTLQRFRFGTDNGNIFSKSSEVWSQALPLNLRKVPDDEFSNTL
jgi:hypothetical protein